MDHKTKHQYAKTFILHSLGSTHIISTGIYYIKLYIKWYKVLNSMLWKVVDLHCYDNFCLKICFPHRPAFVTIISVPNWWNSSQSCFSSRSTRICDNCDTIANVLVKAMAWIFCWKSAHAWCSLMVVSLFCCRWWRWCDWLCRGEVDDGVPFDRKYNS